jgi:hypothetical protein
MSSLPTWQLRIHGRMGHAPVAKLQETAKQGATSKSRNETRGHYLRRPNELHDTRAGRANQWSTYHQQVQVRDGLRWPRQPGGIRTSAEDKLSRRNDRSKTRMTPEPTANLPMKTYQRPRGSGGTKRQPGNGSIKSIGRPADGNVRC